MKEIAIHATKVVYKLTENDFTNFEKFYSSKDKLAAALLDDSVSVMSDLTTTEIFPELTQSESPIIVDLKCAMCGTIGCRLNVDMNIGLCESCTLEAVKAESVTTIQKHTSSLSLDVSTSSAGKNSASGKASVPGNASESFTLDASVIYGSDPDDCDLLFFKRFVTTQVQYTIIVCIFFF